MRRFDAQSLRWLVGARVVAFGGVLDFSNHNGVLYFSVHNGVFKFQIQIDFLSTENRVDNKKLKDSGRKMKIEEER